MLRRFPITLHFIVIICKNKETLWVDIFSNVTVAKYLFVVAFLSKVITVCVCESILSECGSNINVSSNPRKPISETLGSRRGIGPQLPSWRRSDATKINAPRGNTWCRICSKVVSDHRHLNPKNESRVFCPTCWIIPSHLQSRYQALFNCDPIRIIEVILQVTAEESLLIMKTGIE